jgi:hypothetical protein
MMQTSAGQQPPIQPIWLLSLVPPGIGLGVSLLYAISGGREDLSTAALFLGLLCIQGALVICGYARRTISYSQCVSKGIYMTLPIVGVGVLGIIAVVPVGLSQVAPEDIDAFHSSLVPYAVTGGVILSLALGTSILSMPGIVLDEHPLAALIRALLSVWRLVAAAVLGVTYVAAMVAIIWLAPDQLTFAGILAEGQLSLVRDVAGWLGVAVFGLPFWWAVMKLYAAPRVTRAVWSGMPRGRHPEGGCRRSATRWLRRACA